MLSKNQIVPLDITGVTAEGNGVGRFREEEEESSGMAVFVPFTAVGDRILCRILKVQKTFAYGRVEELAEASRDRLPAQEQSCSVFGKCGGCAWRHVTYEAELRYKWQRVADALQRVGGIDVEPDPVVGCDNPDHYRNKAQYPVAAGAHRLLTGFYAPRSHRLVEQRDCPLQPVLFKNVLDTVVRWTKKAGVSAYNEADGTGLLRHIYIRQGEATGEVMVCLVCTSGKVPQSKLLVEMLREAVPGLASVMINVNKADTNVVLGDESFTLWGKDHIRDILCGLEFRISPRSFYQVNRRQAERLYNLAADYAALTGAETVLDLYCGTGTIGLSMADRAAQIIGVEAVSSAVEDAVSNAEANNIANARFICADAAQAAAQLAQEGIRPQVVVIDPPRKGCAAPVIDTIVSMHPERVIYVSCDPATLARDLKFFAENGYAVERVTPVDMFPRTPHVECVVKLGRA